MLPSLLFTTKVKHAIDLQYRYYAFLQLYQLDRTQFLALLRLKHLIPVSVPSQQVQNSFVHFSKYCVGNLNNKLAYTHLLDGAQPHRSLLYHVLLSSSYLLDNCREFIFPASILLNHRTDYNNICTSFSYFLCCFRSTDSTSNYKYSFVVFSHSRYHLGRDTLCSA